VGPNPSLEGTATGKPLGPQAVVVHHPSHGPSVFPASAPQLTRWAPWERSARCSRQHEQRALPLAPSASGDSPCNATKPSGLGCPQRSYTVLRDQPVLPLCWRRFLAPGMCLACAASVLSMGWFGAGS
jgi:hypothetical protein